MWEISITRQVFGFLCAVVLGTALGMLYDILRSLRRTFHHSHLRIAVTDVLFSLLAAFFCLIFEISLTAGQIRFYFIAGIGLGFFIERYTVSRFFCRFFGFLLRKADRIKSLLFSFFGRRILRMERKMTAFSQKTAIFLKKVGKSVKKLLKKG